jgi:hypothetical protein
VVEVVVGVGVVVGVEVVVVNFFQRF